MQNHDVVEERIYTVKQLAEKWHLSEDMIRKLFRNEPGVFVIKNETASKRIYTTLRIPASVVARIFRKNQNN